MATSGTIGLTSIKTSKLLEKALRRCGISPQQQTPEIVSTAQEDLFMFLTSLANRGLNLWCVDKKLMALKAAQASYTLPVGTLDILNLLHGVPVLLSGTITTDANNYQVTLPIASQVVRYGVQFVTTPTIFSLQKSPDGSTWTTVQTVTEVASSGTLNWYDIDPAPTALYYRIHSPVAITITTLYLCETVREIVVAQFNRDDYSNQPNKTLQSSTVTNYYFEKLVSPKLTVWPVPNDATRHLILFRYRQIQDVGTLTDELELPSRWLEAITWHLALRLAFEIPGVEPTRRQEVATMAQSQVIEVEGGETDRAPIYLAPNIRCYSA